MLKEANTKLEKAAKDGQKYPFETVACICKVIQIFTAGLMVLTALIRMTVWTNYSNMTMFMLTINLLLFAVIFILVEFGIANTKVYFFFLNFTWGKALTYCFLGFLLVASGAIKGNTRYYLKWDVGVAIYFFVMTLIFLIMHFVYRA